MNPKVRQKFAASKPACFASAVDHGARSEPVPC